MDDGLSARLTHVHDKLSTHDRGILFLATLTAILALKPQAVSR
jgi:hypothetical protein